MGLQVNTASIAYHPAGLEATFKAKAGERVDKKSADTGTR